MLFVNVLLEKTTNTETNIYTFTEQSWPWPETYITIIAFAITGPGVATSGDSKARVAGVCGHSIKSQCAVIVGDGPVVQWEGGTQNWGWDSEHGGNKSSSLTQVSTEGHVASSGGYSATVEPSGREWVVVSTVQIDWLRSISANVEIVSTSIFWYHTSIGIGPLSQWSITTIVN